MLLPSKASKKPLPRATHGVGNKGLALQSNLQKEPAPRLTTKQDVGSSLLPIGGVATPL